MTPSASGDERHRLLRLYLNDHLMGATGGVRLVRRVRRENAGTPDGPALAALGVEISEDRRTLRAVMAAMGVRVDPLKVAGGAVAELVSRLKPNGRLSRYSPLSRVLELEALHAGVNAKLRLWLTLEQLHRAGEAPDVGGLVSRAETQLERIEEMRERAVAAALAPPSP